MKNNFIIALVIMVATLGASIAQDLRIEAVDTEEQARRIAPLYIRYYQREPWSEEKFMQEWRSIHNDPNYHMLAAYSVKDSPVGFIDGTIFNSLYHRRLMRLDAIFIDGAEISLLQEEPIYRQLYSAIENIAKGKGVTEIQCNSGGKYDQERRLFPLTLHPAATTEESAFYKKALVETRE
jgi:hypothetical protein